MWRSIGCLGRFRHDGTVVLKVIGIMLVATVLLEQAFRQWLCLVLDVLLQLVRPLAEGQTIDVACPADTFLWLEVFVHQVREEPAPIKLKLIRFKLLRLVSLTTLLL